MLSEVEERPRLDTAGYGQHSESMGYQNEQTIYQYPKCTKAGNWVITQLFTPQIKMVYELENTICTTLDGIN